MTPAPGQDGGDELKVVIVIEMRDPHKQMLDVGCDRGVAEQHGPLAAGADVQGPGAGQHGEAQAGP